MIKTLIYILTFIILISCDSEQAKKSSNISAQSNDNSSPSSRESKPFPELLHPTPPPFRGHLTQRYERCTELLPNVCALG